MLQFREKCVLKENNFNQICSNEAVNYAGLSLEEVNKCLYHSIEGTTYEKENTQYQKIAKNKILDKEYQIRKEHLISRVPSLTINGRLYIGAWRPEYIFEAICAALIKKT